MSRFKCFNCGRRFFFYNASSQPDRIPSNPRFHPSVYIHSATFVLHLLWLCLHCLAKDVQFWVCQKGDVWSFVLDVSADLFFFHHILSYLCTTKCISCAYFAVSVITRYANPGGRVTCSFTQCSKSWLMFWGMFIVYSKLQLYKKHLDWTHLDADCLKFPLRRLTLLNFPQLDSLKLVAGSTWIWASLLMSELASL